MPKGILESLLSGEGAIVPHVQPMYRLQDNRMMAQEYLARHLDQQPAKARVTALATNSDSFEQFRLRRPKGQRAAENPAERMAARGIEPRT